MISNLTGEVMTAAPDKFYWRRHLREPVRFGDGMLALGKLDCGPFSSSDHTRCCCRSRKSASETKGKSAPGWRRSIGKSRMSTSITEMLAALYLAGRRIDWTGGACRLRVATNTAAYLSVPAPALLDRGDDDPRQRAPLVEQPASRCGRTR